MLKQELVKKQNIYGVILMVTSLFLLLPQFLLVTLGFGTDHSFGEAFLFLFHHSDKYQFGTDIVYTFGPLGFLFCKVADNWGVALLILLFDAYLLVNHLLIVRKVLPVRSVLQLLLIIATLFFLNKWIKEVGYLLIFVFSVFSFMKDKKTAYLINAAFITVLSFYIKLNFALVQFVFLLIVLFFTIYKEKKLRKVSFITLTGTVISVLGLSILLNVNIPAYLGGASEIIKGYNEAMVIPMAFGVRAFQYAVILLAAYGFLGLYLVLYTNPNWQAYIRYIIIGLFILMVFKYGFVRSDHFTVFFLYIVPFLGIYSLFEEGVYKHRIEQLLVVSFFISSSFFMSAKYFSKEDLARLSPLPYLRDVMGGASNKFGYSDEQKKGRILPEHLRKLIGNSTVDVIGYEQSIVFINKLNYEPAPSIQSYNTYTKKLDSISAYHFLSSRAPAFLFIGNHSIDNRYFYWDESITERVLLHWYDVVDTFRYLGYGDKPYTYLMLQRRSAPATSISAWSQNSQGRLNEAIALDTAEGIQYMFAKFDYTPAGKFKKLAYQPTLINAVLQFESGSSDTVQALLPVMETGVMVNKRISTTFDLGSFWESKGKKCEKVLSIRFIPGDSYSFKQDFEYKFETVHYNQQ